jgi:16S rRNA (adenine1518-N6/adenine1519-N6)-dimethyltransferase
VKKIKKKFGQHFLRDETIVQAAIQAAQLNKTSSVIEIGCGDGFLTNALLQSPLARLWIFEIDPDWSEFVTKKFSDTRIKMHEKDILQVDFRCFKEHKPWILVANIPYQITFPLLHKIKEHRDSISSGVIMIQEEVAQKITKTSGRGYGFSSLFFQHFFTWKKLNKVPPEAFKPKPKIFSRLIHFQAKQKNEKIPEEMRFWAFIKACFNQPRRTLRNNLQQTHYPFHIFSKAILDMRAQQLSMAQFINLWKKIYNIKVSA